MLSWHTERKIALTYLQYTARRFDERIDRWKIDQNEHYILVDRNVWILCNLSSYNFVVSNGRLIILCSASCILKLSLRIPSGKCRPEKIFQIDYIQRIMRTELVLYRIGACSWELLTEWYRVVNASYTLPVLVKKMIKPSCHVHDIQWFPTINNIVQSRWLLHILKDPYIIYFLNQCAVKSNKKYPCTEPSYHISYRNWLIRTKAFHAHFIQYLVLNIWHIAIARLQNKFGLLNLFDESGLIIFSAWHMKLFPGILICSTPIF